LRKWFFHNNWLWLAEAKFRIYFKGLRVCLGELHAASDPKKIAQLQIFSAKHTQLQQLHRGSAPEKRWSRPPTPWFSWSASRGTPPTPNFVELG
jgi:hypothetical protein